ncbi:hypothetical protein T10_9249 [Trichinella papuae]|uniref:Uncharacterized protein n=1 Tax=Trichinella papuae TaxID=268474 RepID=A0A0V1N8A9_9BILA|nr:hypothetical protein T10_9249 [Trichinella papuae]
MSHPPDIRFDGVNRNGMTDVSLVSITQQTKELRQQPL